MTDMNDPMAQFAAAQARITAITEQARANTASASRVAEEARTAEASARSPRGEVVVTARAGGVVSGIEFSPASLQLDAAALGRITVATIAQAQHEAATRFAERASEEFASSPELARELRADAEKAFPPSAADGLRY